MALPCKEATGLPITGLWGGGESMIVKFYKGKVNAVLTQAIVRIVITIRRRRYVLWASVFFVIANGVF